MSRTDYKPHRRSDSAARGDQSHYRLQGLLGGTSIVVHLSNSIHAETLKLCIERTSITTTFTGVETACSPGQAYSGTPITITWDVSGIANETAWHWQARVQDMYGAYSNWVAFGGGSDGNPADVDLGTDTSAPTGGTVYDGTSGGVDAAFNNGALNALSLTGPVSTPTTQVCPSTSTPSARLPVRPTLRPGHRPERPHP